MSETPSSSAANNVILRLFGITKSFGRQVVNKAIDLELTRGEIHVLLGENGAGKSTLLNILYGHLQPDAGWIELLGRRTTVASPAIALQCGIGLVHQHFTLVPSFTVAENVLLGQRHALPKEKRTISAVAKTIASLGWDLDVRRRVEDLPIAGRQLTEILRLLHHGAEVLLMDEPTALLSPREIDSLLTIMERLARKGTSILLVTHKLREVTTSADRITVMRHGAVSARYPTGAVDETELALAMTGRKDIPKIVVSGEVGTAAEPVLQVKNLAVQADHGRAVEAFDIELRPGEIIGIAGVEGNGQHELMAALCGLRAATHGTVVINGVDATAATPWKRRRLGMAIVPADRRRFGVVGTMSVTENLALNDLASKRSRRINWGALNERAERTIEDFDIRPAEPLKAAGQLSGGNVQKLVLARELQSHPKVLLASSPTWGLDVGAVADVRRHLLEARSHGCAILLSSPDLDEIVELSDRILVMYRGSVVLDVARALLDMDRVALAMIGRQVERALG